MKRFRVAVVVCAITGVLAGAACGGDNGTRASQAPSTRAEGREVFPFDGLGDWTSYATQVSIVRVVAERALPAEPPGEPEQYVPRMVSLQIERTIWPDGPVAAHGRIELLTHGWLQGGGTRRQMVADGPRVEVGQRLLMPLFLDEGRWGVLTSSSVIVVTERESVEEAVVTATAGTPAAVALRGRSVAALQRELAATPPHPAAKRHANLPPVERRLAVERELS